MKYVALYILISNLWILYKLIFYKGNKKDLSNTNIILLIIRYILTLFLAIPISILFSLFLFYIHLTTPKINYIKTKADTIKQEYDTLSNQNKLIKTKETEMTNELIHLLFKIKMYQQSTSVIRDVIHVLTPFRNIFIF